MDGTATAGVSTLASRGDHVHPTDTSRFPVSGGTVSGALTVSGATTLATLTTSGATTHNGSLTVAQGAVGANVYLNGNAGTNRIIWFQTAGTLRLAAYASSTAETGSNAGSDFIISCYSDTGAYLGTGMSITRASQVATFPAQINASGGFSAGAPCYITVGSAIENLTLTNSSANFARVIYTVTGVRTWGLGEGGGGNFRLDDLSAGLERWSVDANGLFTVYQAASIGTTLTVNGASTLTGTISCNAINCTIINTQGNTITCGAITCGAITASGVVRATANRVISQGTSNVSLAMYDTAQGVCNILFTGGSNIVYLANADGNGAYAGTWYQYWQGVNSVIAGNLTVNGAFNTNAVICTTINTQGNTITAGPVNAGAIGGTTITASTYVQVSVSGNAVLYLNSVGVRQWYIGAINNGQLYFTDNTGGAVRMIIDTAGTIYTQNGNVQMGSGQLVCGYISATFIDLSNGAGIGFAQQGGASRKSFTSTGVQLTHYINGTAAGSWNFNAPSDERIKLNIKAIEGNPLEELTQVRLVSYDENFFRTGEHVACGFSAQQLMMIIPEAVIRAPYFHGEEDKRMSPFDDGHMLSVDVMPLIARLVGAVQQLKSSNDALKARLDALAA
jgi:hypothetical protein